MSILDLEAKIAEIQARLDEISIENHAEVEELQQQLRLYKTRAYENLTAWDHVTLARHPKRPKARDYIDYIFDSFIELHGDRLYRDDEAIIGGIAKLGNQVVTVIAHQKGNTTAENIKYNFGMPHPEGYRKALRLAKQAEKFNRPIITFVDTPGAYPGKEAEEKGQAQAIADCLYTFSSLKTPVICFVLSEGGSGGALALSVADKIFMLEYAVYSILSPEGFASILWKDGSRAKEACDVMKLTSKDLLEKKVIDEIVPEPFGGAASNLQSVVDKMDLMLKETLNELTKMKTTTLVEKRYEKFRHLGEGSWKMSR